MASASAPARCRLPAIRTSAGVGSSPVPSIRCAMREGIFGLLSTMRCMWSWSSCAGVFATTRRIRSTVASGPIPPMMPTMRCVDFESGRLGMRRAAKSEVIHVAKQPGAAAGMDKHDVLCFLEHPFANQVDETRHTLAGVHRVEEDSFEPGERAYGSEGIGGREPISCADVVAVRDHVLAAHRSGCAAQLCGGTGQLEHILLLSIARCANPYSQQRDTGPYTGESGNQSRLRPGAAGCVHDMIDPQTQVICLPDEFDRCIDVAKSAGGSRSSARYEVWFADVALQPGGHLGQLAVHVRIGRAMFDGRPMQMVQKDIAALRVVMVGLAGSILEQDMAIDAHFRGARRGLPRVIRLRRSLS